MTELQRQYDEAFLEEKEMNAQEESVEIGLEKESRMLRRLLIKSAEKVKENQKLLSFMRQVELSKNKADQYDMDDVGS